MGNSFLEKKSPSVSVCVLEIHKKMLIELLRGRNLFVTFSFCSDVCRMKESETVFWGKNYEFEVIFQAFKFLLKVIF